MGRLADWQRIADIGAQDARGHVGVPLIEQPLMASANGRVEGVLVRGMRIEDIRAQRTLTSNVVVGRSPLRSSG